MNRPGNSDLFYYQKDHFSSNGPPHEHKIKTRGLFYVSFYTPGWYHRNSPTKVHEGMLKMRSVKIIRLDSDQTGKKEYVRYYDDIAAELSSGKIIALPSDTFYALSTDPFNILSVERLLRIKKRHPSNPMPLFIESIETITGVGNADPRLLETLAANFWPGPLTVVIRASGNLPGITLGHTGKAGVRIPDYPPLNEVLKRAGGIAVGTSANRSGAPPLPDAKAILEEFGNELDLVVDGGRSKGALPSTVIDITGKTPLILREGAVSLTAIREAGIRVEGVVKNRR